ncbi:MAG: tRNA pseudouridine(38-40) synthase TruA [Clostridia bacterium]|nr:tRNA pseudouridine(38-40) synthase TruA [Clostridia bacterium]
MRYKIVFSYDGSQYCGMQIQKDKLTIAKVLNDNLSNILCVPIEVVASGRTDSGVSAIEQVGHFDYDGDLPKNFVGYINSVLPASIRVHSVAVAPNFHARYDAKEKTYIYKFYVSKNANAFYDKFALQVPKCDIDKVKKSLKYLIGTHDFTSFCASGTGVKDMVRTITSASIDGDGEVYTFTIAGNGFLYNMVRIIVGTLIEIGSKGLAPGHMKNVIDGKNRKLAGPTKPAYPLVLKSVSYIQ